MTPNAISPASHALAGLLFSGSRQKDAGTLLQPVPRAGGRARMFWRKYSTSEAVTAGNASGGTTFALSGSFLARVARRSGAKCGRDVLKDDGKCWVSLVGAREKAPSQPRINFSAGHRA